MKWNYFPKGRIVPHKLLVVPRRPETGPGGSASRANVEPGRLPRRASGAAQRAGRQIKMQNRQQVI